MQKKRILSIALTLIILGATIMGFLVPVIAHAESSDGHAACTKVQVNRKIDRYHYDLTLTFEIPSLKFEDVKEKFPVNSFDKNDDDHSTIKLNNGSSSDGAFFSYSYADLEFWNPKTYEGSNLKFYVKLHDVEYDGEGNTIDLKANFKVKVLDEDNGYKIETYNTNDFEVTFVDGDELDKIDQEGLDEAKPDAATPYIIISDYKIDKPQLFAGDKFNLDLTMKNTNRRLDIENILMKVNVTDGFSILNSSNTFHFDTLPTQDSIKKQLALMVLPTAETKTYTITVSFTYEYVYDHTRKQGTCEEVISQAVNQKERFTVSPVTLQSDIFPGEEAALDIECINKGKTQIFNVAAEIEGNINNANQYEYVGNIGAGATETITFFVANDEPGAEVQGNVIVTYEDEAGNIKTKTIPYGTNTMEIDPNEGMDMDIPTDGMIDGEFEEDMEKPGLTNLHKGLIAAGVVVVLVIVYKVVKKRKELKEFEDDDEIN